MSEAVLTDDHVMSVCRPGAGHDTCRYLAMGAGTARGDNCEGVL
jgi:hypothetical protein